jgi:CheY-like chemotaxis protein
MKELNNLTVVSKGKVLVMDDEEIILDVVGETLSESGYEVGLARNGPEAIELYRIAMESGEPFDVVIMDLLIGGGMGGMEAIRGLLTIDPEAKAIASTGDSNNPAITDFGDYGFKGAITKPYRATELVELVNNLMEGDKG